MARTYQTIPSYKFKKHGCLIIRKLNESKLILFIKIIQIQTQVKDACTHLNFFMCHVTLFFKGYLRPEKENCRKCD